MQIPNQIQSIAGGHRINFISPEPMGALDERPRLRFWEIEALFKCPAIGWCLNIVEQREILRKEGISIKNLSDFNAHEILLDSLKSESRLSRRIDFWLNRKYKKEVTELSCLEQGEFIKHWKTSLREGKVEGILWVAVTKTDLSTEVKRSIFGDVHMEMHVRAKQISNERQRFDQERQRSEILARSVMELNRANKILKRENERVRNELSKTCQLSDTLQKQNHELEKELSKVNENILIVSLQKENAELRDEGKRMTEQILTYQRELRILQNQNNKLLCKLEKQSQIRSYLSKEIETAISQFSASNGDGGPPSSLDLSQRCILIVGGLFKMETLYRQCIEENGGIFEYHDGQMNAGTKKLENQVRRADLVLCPINYNSHTASLVVKKLCKKYKKPVRILSNSSLSAISSTLLAVQGGFPTIHNGQDDLPQQSI